MKRKPLLVAVVGGSGSGKSWLCEKLRRALGKNAGRLSLDDFYRDRSHLALSRRARINFDHPRAIDWAVFERALAECSAGKSTRVPAYDFKTHSRRARPRIVRPKPVILVDGLWLLHRAKLRRLFGLSIYLHCPARTRLTRRLARDLLKRGRCAQSVRNQFRTTVEPMHQRFVEPQAIWAGRVYRKPIGQREVVKLLALLRKVSSMINSTP